MITTLCTLSFTNLIYLLLESLFLGLCQSDLVTEFMLDDTNCMLVVKVIIRDLIVTGLWCCVSLLKLCDLCFEVISFQVELLLAHRTIFLITLDCILEEYILPIEDLHEILTLITQPIHIFVWQYNSLNNSTSLLSQIIRETAASAHDWGSSLLPQASVVGFGRNFLVDEHALLGLLWLQVRLILWPFLIIELCRCVRSTIAVVLLLVRIDGVLSRLLSDLNVYGL